MPTARSRKLPPLDADHPDADHAEAGLPDPDQPAALSGADTLRAGIQSVEVGFTLLAVMAESDGPLMLRDIAAAAGMSAAKAHRYLVSFQRLGLVHQDPLNTRYDLGPAALRLGLASLARLDAVRLARERADALLSETGHTMAIAVWGNQGPTIVHWSEAPRTVPVSLRLGDVMPLLTSATGRCFAAFTPPGGLEAQRLRPMLLEELKYATRHPHPDIPQTLAAAEALFAEVRQRGLARVVNALLTGVAGFCAPVFDAQGRIAMGVVVLGSVSTFDSSWDGPLAQALLRCTRQLSADLGYRPAGVSG
jgi:DNA-binding IclR family transcriptional regulator